MNKIYTLSGFIAFLFVSFSCFEDKGSYDLTALQDISFATTSDSVYVMIGNNFDIAIETETSIPEADLKYMWYLSGEFGSIDTLANTKYLTELVTLEPGEYDLCLEVLNTNNNVRYQECLKVFVETPFSSGLCILKDEEGKARFDFISSIGEYRYYSNVCRNITKEELDGEPVKIDVADSRSGYYNIVSVITSTGGLVLDGYSMEKEFAILDEFISTEHLDSYRPITGGFLETFAFGWSKFATVIAGGKVFTKQISNSDIRSGYWEAPVDGDYHVKHVASQDWPLMQLFYDELNQKYTYLIRDNTIKMVDVTVENPDELAFDPANVGKECLWMETATKWYWVSRDLTFAIMKDDVGKFYLQQFWYKERTEEFVAEYEMPFPEGSVDDNSKFVCNYAYPYVYVSQANRVHRYNSTTNFLEQDWLVLNNNVISMGVSNNGGELAIATQVGADSKVALYNMLSSAYPVISSWDVKGVVKDLKFK